MQIFPFKNVFNLFLELTIRTGRKILKKKFYI
jgi:hypothetical protein